MKYKPKEQPQATVNPGVREIEHARIILYDVVSFHNVDSGISRNVSVTVKYVHHTRMLRIQYMLPDPSGVRIPLGKPLDIPLSDVQSDRLLDWMPRISEQHKMCLALLALDTSPT